MSKAAVKDVLGLRGSQSSAVLASPDEDERSIVDKLYTKSEKSLLEGVWEAKQPDMPLTDEDLAIVMEDSLEVVGTKVAMEGAPDPESLRHVGILTMLRESLPYWGMPEGGLHEAVRRALSKVASNEINVVDGDSGESPLMLCAQYGAGELVELLVAQNAAVNHTLPSGASALHYMTNLSTLSPAAVDKLLQFGADPNLAEQHNGATPLHYAADAGDLAVCKNLVKYGADVNATDYGGYDAAGYADAAGHAKVADYVRQCQGLSSSSSGGPGAKQHGGGGYSIDIPPLTAANAVLATPASLDNNNDQKAAAAAAKKQQGSSKGSVKFDKEIPAPPKRRRSREIVAEVNEARLTLARLENDRNRLETEQKAVKFKYEAEDAVQRLERSEQRASEAAQEAAGLRAKLEGAQAAAEKAEADLKAAQSESALLTASAASAASAAQARAEEIERARARASSVSETSAERAISAELAAAVAKNEADMARRERAFALEEAEKNLQRAHAAELRCEAAAAAAAAEREADRRFAAESEKKAKDYARAAAENVVALMNNNHTKSSGNEVETNNDDLAAAAQKACEAVQYESAKSREATQVIVEALKASLEERALACEAKCVDVVRDAEEAKAALSKAKEEGATLAATLQKREAELAEQIQAAFAKCEAHEEERRSALTQLAVETSDKAAALGRAERAEARATTLEQSLVDLAQTSSADEKVQAMERSMQAKVLDLERARDEALAKVQAARGDKDAAWVSSLEAVLGKFDAETAGPRFRRDLEVALAGAFEKMRGEDASKMMEAASTEQRVDLERRAEEASKEAAFIRKELSEAREKLVASVARASAAEEARETAATEARRLREEVTQLRCEEKAARAEAAASKEAALVAQSKAEQLATELTAQKVALASAVAEKARLDEDLAQAKSGLRRAEEETASAKSEQRRIEAEAQAAFRRFEGETEKRAARDNVDAFKAAALKDREYEAQLSEAKRTATHARSEAEAAAKRVENLIEKVKVAEERSEASAAALEAMRRERDVATMALLETSESAESELARARSKVASSQAELATASTALERVRALEGRNAQLDRDLTREATLRRKLHNTIEDMKGKIRVLCRVRPLSAAEASTSSISGDYYQQAVVKDGEVSLTVMPQRRDADRKRFSFDEVYEGAAGNGNTQAKIFEDVRLLVTSAVDGYNVCLFAYGQTGSGKTFTMGSASTIGEAFDHTGHIVSDAGIAPRTAAAVFEILKDRSSQCESEVKLSMFEVYCDKIIDLLNPDRQQQGQLKITLAEHSPTGLVVVEGAHSYTAKTVDGLVKGMAKGIGARTTHATRMNMESSRSHLIMSLEVRTTNRRTAALVAGKIFFLRRHNLPTRQDHSRGPRRLRARRKVGGHRRPPQRGHGHQQVPLGPRRRHQRPHQRHRRPRTLPEPPPHHAHVRQRRRLRQDVSFIYLPSTLTPKTTG